MLKLPNGNPAKGIVTLIGKRPTDKIIIPKEIEDTFYRLTLWFMDNSFMCRSGGADGIDWICEEAANNSSYPENFIAYLPWKGFGMDSKVTKVRPIHTRWHIGQSIVEEQVSWWGKMPDPVRALYTRNLFQVAGGKLDKIADICVYWTPIVNGGIKGGTSIAIKLCDYFKVPSFNLYDPANYDLLVSYIAEKFNLVLDLKKFSGIYYSNVRTQYITNSGAKQHEIGDSM